MTHSKIATTSSTWRPNRRLSDRSNVQMPKASLPTIQLGTARAAPVKSSVPIAITCSKNNSRCNSSSSSSSPLSAAARPHVMKMVPLASVSKSSRLPDNNSSKNNSKLRVANLNLLRIRRLSSSRCTKRLKDHSASLKLAIKNLSVLVS